jgi:hypothetical protein
VEYTQSSQDTAEYTQPSQDKEESDSGRDSNVNDTLLSMLEDWKNHDQHKELSYRSLQDSMGEMSQNIKDMQAVLSSLTASVTTIMSTSSSDV